MTSTGRAEDQGTPMHRDLAHASSSTAISVPRQWRVLVQLVCSPTRAHRVGTGDLKAARDAGIVTLPTLPKPANGVDNAGSGRVDFLACGESPETEPE